MQTMSAPKRVGAVSFGVMATLALAAALAYACTNLATLNLSESAVSSGDELAITGSSFAAEHPVVLHWNSVEGAELATVEPDVAGNITASVTVPEAQPGYYVIVATQTDEEGTQQFGGPARAAVEVVGPGGETLVAQPAGQPLSPVGADSSGTSVGLIALTVALGVIGLGLFGAGVVGFARQRGEAAPAKVHSE